MNKLRSHRCGGKSRWPAMLLSLALAACGGGGDGSVGSGGTGSNGSTSAVDTVAVGPITGFGSIWVNGVKYDDSAASLSSDDRGGFSRSDLRLGMIVEVRGTSNPSTGLGAASSIAVRSELKGIVQNRTASDFVLLGVTVRTDASTVYDNASNVVDGDFVEVYGVYDANTRSLRATRVEKKVAAEFKLRGRITGLDTALRRFSIGTQLIDYTNAGSVGVLANGMEVQVRGPAPVAGAAWSITSLSSISGLSVASGARVELEAVIEQFVSASNFKLAGLTVDASTAQFERGTVAQLANGVAVEVKGSVENGIIKATKVEFEGSSGSGSSGSSGGSSGVGEFEVKGRVESFASLASFLVRGTRIDATGTVTYDGGTAGQVVNGVCLEVKGVLGTTSSGSSVRASRIKFDNDC